MRSPLRYIRRLAYPILVIAAVAAAYFALRGLHIAGMPWQVYLERGRLIADLAHQRLTHGSLQVTLDPEHGTLQGRARLSMESSAQGLPRFRLILNEGLKITAARCNGASVEVWRSGAFLRVHPAVAAPEYVLELLYEGALASAPAAAHMAEDEIILPALSFWHPHDLHSFATLELDLTLPEPLRPVLGSAPEPAYAPEGLRRVTWTAPRPLAGLSLAAGAHQEHSLRYGALHSRVYRAVPDGAGRLPQDIGRLHAYYETLLGKSDLSQIEVWLSPHIEQPYTAGHGLLILPESPGDISLPLLAEAVARLWFPGQVSGQWFPARPAGGYWIAEALPRYLAWRALDYLEGEEAVLDELSALAPLLATVPATPRPLRGLERAVLLRDAAGLEERRAYMAQVARLLAATVGEDSLTQTLRKLLARNRYRSISLDQLLAGLELSSERDLSEWARVWFDRSARVDFAIAEVHHEGGQLRVEVQNLGLMPAPIPLTLLIEAGDRREHQITVGAGGATLEIPSQAPPTKILLDPHYLLPDANRVNNAWPPQEPN